jgi:hypothetical protein
MERSAPRHAMSAAPGGVAGLLEIMRACTTDCTRCASSSGASNSLCDLFERTTEGNKQGVTERE